MSLASWGRALRSVVAALLSALAPPKHLRQELGPDLGDAAVHFYRTFLPLSSTWT